LIGVHEFEAHGKLQRLLKIRNPWGKKGEWDGDWSDTSKLWTPQLDKLLDHTNANDGIFFIPIEDYLTHYNQTAISITESADCPISLANYKKDETAYYSFELTKDNPYMAITVCQQGDRLKRYRPKGGKDLFIPSPFSMILINTDTDEIIGESRETSHSNFFHSLLIHRPIIDKGRYVLVVDACWDPCVSLDPLYEDVLVRLYCN
jgi:hypothetical protein